MKLTTSAAIAVAATGAAAQDGWSAWSSTGSSKPVAASSTTPASQSCPATVTSIKTESTTAYESTSEVYKSTVTVPIPDKPNSFSVPPQWVDWDTTATGAPVTSAPAGCSVGKTVTSTSTLTSTISGTTTVTKSVLFVAAQATGSADAAWSSWKPDNVPGSSGSPSSNGNSGSNTPSSSNGNSGSGSSSGSGNSGSNNGNGWGIGSSSGNDGTNGNSGWGQGSWGGKGDGGDVLGSGADVFSFIPSGPTNTHSGIAPIYTKGPQGWSGVPFGGLLDGIADAIGDTIGEIGDDIGDLLGGWGDDNDGSNNNNNNGGNNGGNGSGPKNSTSPANNTNGTSPGGAYGSDSSNVTKPFDILKDSQCNDANSRNKWCGGLDTTTDYYQDYWNDLKGAAGWDKPTSGSGLNPFGGSCEYDLTISAGTWNTDGTTVPMMLVNGQFPGPAIECNWGDLVKITVHNQLTNNGTTIHWHGIRQVGTNDQDGVPGVTECAVAPGSSRTYTWRATSYGTSWYHSHWNLQYGDGVQGPIIIHGPATANYDVDAGPVMITDTYPSHMTATAFGSIVAHVGPQNTENYLLNGKNTVYDLSSGQHALWKVQKGKKYLFRIINSAAQNMYSVSIDQHKFKVIAADFVPINPYTTSWLNIGIGQRYDVVVEMDQDVETYFFRAVTQTLCPSGSVNSGLGQANGIIAYEGVHENPIHLPTSTLNGNKTAADFATCKDEPLASLVPALSLGAGSKSAFQASASTLPGGTVTKVGTADDGAVFRWFLNNGAAYINYTQPTLQSLHDDIAMNSSSYANQITLNQKNEWVYFAIQNQFFAFHPMHLHGHDFSVLGQGDGLFTADLVDTLNFDNPTRRDTAMLAGAASPGAASGGYTVIGFQTDNPGAWLMHCHIAWHVDGGLALQWIERPNDIDSYASSSDFKNECSAYTSYEASSPSGKKLSGQSGLKRSEPTFFDKMNAHVNRQFNSVVRRDNHAAHHFLDTHMKRGLGDGGNRRTFGRR